MSVSDDHYEQARQNRVLAERLLAGGTGDPPSVQWAVTMAFYCAVHCIQGYLLARGYDPRNHGERGALVTSSQVGFPMPVQHAYFWLKARSERARYRLGVFAPSFVQQRVLDEKLKLVTDFVGL